MYFELEGGSPVRQFQNVVLQCAGTVQEHFRHMENKTNCRLVYIDPRGGCVVH
jgi:hypothetical protein